MPVRYKVRQYFDMLAWPLLWLLAATVFFWLLLFIFTEDRIKFVRIISYFQPCLLFLLLPASILAFLGKRRILGLIFFCLIVLISLPSLHLFLPRFGEQPSTGRGLKVMSYSVNGWNKDVGAIAKVIRKTGADIILEQGAPHSEQLLAEFQNLYPDGEIHTLNYKVSGVISRYPITPLRGISAAQKARVEIPGGPSVTLWIVHTNKDPYGYQNQIRQVQGIVADVLKTDGPKIVAGDFNTSKGSVPYQMLEKVLYNAHDEAGWGFGFTYPTPIRRLGKITPFIRIDHIWYSDDFYAAKAKTLRDHGGSDHFPIIAELLFVKDPDQ